MRGKEISDLGHRIRFRTGTKREKEKRKARSNKIVDNVQYKSLKVIQNRGKSKKSKTIFVVSPIEDLNGFH